MTEYYVVSARDVRATPAQGCLNEFEDVLVDCCSAALVLPRRAGRGGRFARPLRVEVPARRTREPQVLVIVGIALSFVVDVLASLRGWRSRFDVVSAYVFDGWLPETERDKPAWKKALSPFSRPLQSLDHLFVPMSGSSAELAAEYGIRVSMVPMACDVVRFGSAGRSRAIDVNGFGRQLASHSRALAAAFNAPGSGRIYYHTDHMTIGAVRDLAAHRALFWKLLARSRIALAYDPMVANNEGRFRFSFVGQRWFESITAGCLVVGRRPTCPEMDRLFDWEDATVEVPASDAELLPFMEALLADRGRLEAAHVRNHANALARHDWRHRVAQMVDCLGQPRPEALERQLDRLRGLAARAPAA